MRYIPRVRPYDRPEFGFMAPTDEVCPICGRDIWPDEETDFSKNGYFCHAACAEKEEAKL